jgi:PAS domain S-box-containing protein
MTLDLKKIIDFERLPRLLEAFHVATGIAVSIVSLDGEVCTQSGYQKICSDFYRRHPETASACLSYESRFFPEPMLEQPPIIQSCPRGLFHGATPIVVDRNHVASLITGAFLFEPPDAEVMRSFRQQASKWNFDEAAFINAVLEIPIISEERIEAVLQFLRQLVDMLGEMRRCTQNPEQGEKRFLDTKKDMPGATESIWGTSERREAEQDLHASKARYRQLFDSANDGIFVLKDGIVVDCNQKALELFKVSREEAIGQVAVNFSPEIQPGGQSSSAELQKRRDLVIKGVRQFFDWRFFRKDGSSFDAEVSVTRSMINDVAHTLAIVRDITERKQMIHSLQQREKELDEKTRYLEKVNQALKASLDHREVEKRAVEENMLVNLKRFVFPYIEELGRCNIDTDARAYLNIIKTNLNDIVSRAAKTVFWKYLDLTPTEVRIADLIRNGRNSKAIARILGLSPSSVQWHRKNIREKLGLTNKKVNLQTYLTSLSE